MYYYCPADGSELKRRNEEGGCVFECPVCGGRMVNVAVLKRNPALRAGMDAIWSEAMSGERTEGRKCPECGVPMSCVSIPGSQQKVDVCKTCQLIWLDVGELEALPHRAVKKQTEFSSEEKQVLAAMQLSGIEYERKLMDRKLEQDNRALETLAMLTCLPEESEEDAAPLKTLPLVTWTVAAIIVITYLFSVRELGELVKNMGFMLDAPFRQGGLTIFMSFFIQANIGQLLFNLYFLLTFGDNAEDAMGHALYAILLLLGHIAGLLCYFALNIFDMEPFVGANAGISAAFTSYVLLHPNKTFTFYALPVLRIYAVETKAFVFLIVWVMYNFIICGLNGGVFFSNAEAFAHLGGFLLGLVWALGLWVMRPKTEKQVVTTQDDDFE